MSKHSELTLKDIRGLIDPLCPIKIIYNGKVVWDDNKPIGHKLCDPVTYDNFWEENKDINISKFKVDIIQFHHSKVTIWSVNE